MSKYSKMNIVYLLQKWMDSVPGQTFLNYAYSWGASIVILGALFKLTHLPGANLMLFIGMGTEVVVFFLSAFDRPFDKSAIDKPLDIHLNDSMQDDAEMDAIPADNKGQMAPVAVQSQNGGMAGGTIIIGGGSHEATGSISFNGDNGAAQHSGDNAKMTMSRQDAVTDTPSGNAAATHIVTPAPAVSAETAEAMETATTSYVDHLNELNEMLEKVAAQSARLATDSEEMENLNRTLTGISRVYEMQLKSASQQITTQDEINEQTKRMAKQIQELNAIYTRMIEAMTVNMNPLATQKSDN